MTGAMTSAEEMFLGDEKGLCSYWEAYWKLYQGRAFPKEIDLRLVVKSLQGGLEPRSAKIPHVGRGGGQEIERAQG